MNDKKWTEGPWEVQTYQEPFDAGKTYYQVTTIPEQIQVAKCGVGEFEIPGNAHLIAAAPELYEALDELADLMQGVIDGDYKPDSYTLQVAKVALAKARGVDNE
jgi:hypothetical protein